MNPTTTRPVPAEWTPRRTRASRYWAVSCIPSDDPSLNAAAHDALVVARRDLMTDPRGGEMAARMSRILRVVYPQVVVAPRPAMTDLGEELAWFVYRDGPLVASNGNRPRDRRGSRDRR